MIITNVDKFHSAIEIYWAAVGFALGVTDWWVLSRGNGLVGFAQG